MRVKTLIISSSKISDKINSSQNYELFQLSECAKSYYEKIFVLDPNKLKFIVRPENGIVEVFYNNISLSNACSLIVRATNGCEEATRMMALSLYSQGCEFLDPVERFNGSMAGKAIMSLKGMKDNSLPDTYIAYNPNTALNMLESLIPSKQFPLVGKPTNGGRGTDVVFLPNLERAKQYSKSFFQKYKSGSSGILFQQYINILHEYRVLLLSGEIIGIAEKQESEHSFGRNASKGSVFTISENDTVGEFAKKYASNKGLLGVDVAEDKQGKLFIIESNRSPQWQEFEKATGINVAEEILQHLEKRLKVSSELF